LRVILFLRKEGVGPLTSDEEREKGVSTGQMMLDKNITGVAHGLWDC